MFPGWVYGYGRNKLKDTYTIIHNQWAPINPSIRNMYVYENIWNRIGKGKHKLSYVLWVGIWVRKK